MLQCASCSIAAFGLFHYENYSMERKSGDLANKVAPIGGYVMSRSA